MSELGGYLVQAAVTLALIAIGAVAAVWVVRKWLMPGGSGAGELRVVDQLSLGVGARLVLVEVGGRRLLLGVAPQGISLLCELPGSGQEREDV